MSSAFLSYVGAFSWEFRTDLVYQDWVSDLRNRGVPLSDPYRVEDLLTNDVEISKYVMCLCQPHSFPNSAFLILRK